MFRFIDYCFSVYFSWSYSQVNAEVSATPDTRPASAEAVLLGDGAISAKNTSVEELKVSSCVFEICSNEL